MDERHYWFATKLQDTFRFGGYDNPSLLEDFLSDYEVTDTISRFLAPGGPRSIFFYCEEEAADVATAGLPAGGSSRQLHVAVRMRPDVLLRSKVCLYVMRHSLDGDIDASQLDKELFCGELRHSAISNLSTLLTEAYGPVLRRQTDWGACTKDNVSSFFQTFDRVSYSLAELAAESLTQRAMLQRPTAGLASSVMQQHGGRFIFTAEAVEECEQLVVDWVDTIDSLLLDAMDERLEDPHSGIAAEFSKWERRRTLLVSVIEQLREREMKAIITALVASKSKVLKRWKAIDARLTEAFNSTKDKVWFLSALQPVMDAINTAESLSSIVSGTFHTLFITVKQMDSLSRHYAKSGYLGIVLKKVANVLTDHFQQLLTDCYSEEDDCWDLFWENVFKAAAGSASEPHKLVNCLKDCIQLSRAYRDVVQQIRDVLFGHHTFAGSVPTGSRKLVSKETMIKMSSKSSTLQRLAEDSVVSSSMSTASSQVVCLQLHCIDGITESLSDVASRAEKILEIISTLGQLSSLPYTIAGLPQVKGLCAVPHKQDTLKCHNGTGTLLTTGTGSSVSSGGDVHSRMNMADSESSTDAAGTGAVKEAGSNDEGSGNNKEPLVTIVSSMDETGVSIAQLVFRSVRSIKDTLQSVCPVGVRQVFAVSGSEKQAFHTCYQRYQQLVGEAEEIISKYMTAVCTHLTHSQDVLNIIDNFSAVSSRSALQPAMNKCYLLAFVRYASELERIQQQYEQHKASPLLAVGRPPIAGAVEWTRNLLRRVEVPMESFRNNASLMKTSESLYTCKLHNKLATALLQCESVWLGRWRDMASRAHGILQTHILVCNHGSSGQEKREGGGGGGGGVGGLKIPAITVNTHNGIMEILAEGRALRQLGVPMPDSVVSILNQERRIKQFHQLLQQTLRELYSALEKIDPRLTTLFQPLVEMVTRLFLPGWTTLTWSMLNIDAFLYQVDTATSMLTSVVQQTTSILQHRVYHLIDEISSLNLYDEELATSKLWHPALFTTAMLDSIQSRADDITDKANQVKTALKEIVTLVRSKEDHLIAQQVQKQHQQHRWAKPVELMLHSSLVKKGKRERHSSTMNPLSLAEQSDLPASRKSGSFHHAIQSVLGEFGVLIDNAVIKVVEQSHSHLCQSVCQLPQVLASAVMSNGGRGGGGGGGGGQRKKKKLRLEVRMKFTIPSITLDPSIENVNDHMTRLSSAILHVLRKLPSWGNMDRKEMREVENKLQLEQVLMQEHFEGLHPRVEEFIITLKQFDSLWQNDLYATFHQFMDTCISDQQYTAMIEQLLETENAVLTLPDRLNFPSLTVSTSPLKNTLRSLASNWRGLFISPLHENAKATLDVLVARRDAIMDQLQKPVLTSDLPALRAVLELLQEVDNLNLTIDNEYLPVENMYSLLKCYEPLLPRTEVKQVEELRQKWEELGSLADKVRQRLLCEDRLLYEQEVDKQVKAFSVKTIQFRNSFDSEGPIMPGISPAEALTRLGSFLSQNIDLEHNRELLVAVQILLKIPPSVFPELDHTQEELAYLRSLYSNYQEVMAFNENFRQQLWVDVDLYSAQEQVDQFWQTFLSLPLEQREWEASRKLCQEIRHYQQVLPILESLHGKEVRSRHWLQIMSVTSCSFQLEASIFRMGHLLDAGLTRHVAEVEEIVRNAQQELALEKQYLAIEEDWTEQVIQIEPHPSSGGCPLLSPGSTHNLLEQLESSRIQLFAMLNSRHVQHVKSEVAVWAEKLGGVSEVLQLWLSVQEMWLSLQAVFSDPRTAKDFSEESVKFSAIDATWKKIMQRATVIKTCIRCCLEGEEQLLTALQSLSREMEECKRSLVSYLTAKRERFPRFYLLPDDCLLSILSNPASTDSVKPFLPTMFAGVSELVASDDLITTAVSPTGEELLLSQHVQLSDSVEGWLSYLLSSTKTTIQQLLLQAMDSDLPSLEELVLYHVTQVACVALHHQWTKDCEQALSSCRYDRKALPGLRAKFNTSVVSRLNTLVMRSTWRHTDDTVTLQHRNRLEVMIVLSLWLRDIIDDMCLRKLKEKADFEWMRFPRLYLYASGDGQQEIRMQCLSYELAYGCEYVGCQPLPVFSPRDGCYMISLTQSLHERVGSCAISAPGYNRTETIKGVGFLLGQFNAVLQCFSLTTAAAITNTFIAICREGCWGCFADIQALTCSAISVLARCCDTVLTALRAKHTTLLLPPGTQVSLLPTTAIFATHLPASSSCWKLPPTIATLFRTFALAPPDPYLMLRSTCVALGLKSSRVLSNKLAMFLSLVNKQLPLSSGCQERISVMVLRHVVMVAVARMRTALPGSSHAGLNIPSGMSRLDVSLKSAHVTPGLPPLRDGKTLKPIAQVSRQSANTTPLNDHAVITDTITSLLGSRFSVDEFLVFQSIVHDVFEGRDNTRLLKKKSVLEGTVNEAPPIPPIYTNYLQVHDAGDIRDLLSYETEKAGLHAGKNWLDKLEQLLNMTLVKQAIVLCGKEASGKTSALQTVIAMLNTLSVSNDHTPVKLQRIYPGALPSISDLYGYYDTHAESWSDGIFTSLVRRALKASQTTTWVCFDGVLESSWTHYLSELVSSSKVMTLASGEQFALTGSSLKLLFETDKLQHTSPDIITHCGIMHFDSTVLGWKALSTSWLASRRGDEADCVKRLMDLVMNQVVDFVINKSTVGDQHSEVSLTNTCLSYLSSLINIYSETAEVYSVQHVEKLLLFSIVWSFGGVLTFDKDRTRFTQLMKRLSNSFPDDSEFTVFDYYVDESGEWDVWMSRMSEKPCKGVNLMGTAFVETTKTIRTEVLLELAQAARKHVLLIGPHASGKTSVIDHFLSNRVLNFSKTESVKRVVLNGHTQSSDLHNVIRVHLHHRQGYTYGPPHNRLLQLIVDDLHVPLVSGATPTAHEYLRQMLDSNGLYNMKKTNEWSAIEDLLIFATFSKTSDQQYRLHSRLMRHFAVIPVDDLTVADLKTIVPAIVNSLTSLVYTNSTELIRKIAQGSIIVYQYVSNLLQHSNTSGRQHYFFSLAQLESAVQGLCYLSKDAFTKQEDMFSVGVPLFKKHSMFGQKASFCSTSEDTSTHQMGAMWQFEIERAYGSGLCQSKDIDMLQKQVRNLAIKVFDLPSSQQDNVSYSSISIQTENIQERSPQAPLVTLPEITLYPIREWKLLKHPISHLLSRCNEEHTPPLQLKLSDNIIESVANLHRVIKHPRGNCILVGSHGQPVEEIATLALYIGGYSVHRMATDSDNSFHDQLRSLFRLAALERKQVALVINEKDLSSHEVLSTLNSLTACHELPTLFTTDEMEGLLHSMLPSIKKDFPNELIDPECYFAALIAQNVRVVLCVTPAWSLLNNEAFHYQGMLKQCHIMWVQEWNKNHIETEIKTFFEEDPTASVITNKLRQPVRDCVAAIHQCMLQQSGTLKQAGLSPSLAADNSAPISKSKQKLPSKAAPPLSIDYLWEKLTKLHHQDSPNTQLLGMAGGYFSLPYIGRESLLMFLCALCRLYKVKSTAAIKQRDSLSKALAMLQNVRDKVKMMQDSHNTHKKELEEKSTVSSQLLDSLTAKSCERERAHALMGREGAVLSTMKRVAEQQRILNEHDEDDGELLAIFAQGLAKKTSRLEEMVSRAIEQLAAAEQEEMETFELTKRNKDQARYWQSRIDRNTIDQIKYLNNPPSLVGSVLELMLTLLHKYGTPSSASEQERSTLMPEIMQRKPSLSVRGNSSKMDKDHWLALQQALGDSQHFLDLLNSLKWEDGLPPEAVNLIESKIATTGNTDGRMSNLLRWDTAMAVGDRGGTAMGKITPGGAGGGGGGSSSTFASPNLITVAAARHAAEAASFMCSFATSIVQYQRSIEPHRQAKERVAKLRDNLAALQKDLAQQREKRLLDETLGTAKVKEAEHQEEEDVGEAKLLKIEEELAAIRKQFDSAVMEKHTLKRNCQLLTEKLKLAQTTLESFEDAEEKWRKKFSELPSNECLLANCILAAAFIVYCGPLSARARTHAFARISSAITSSSFRLSDKDKTQLLTLSSLPAFLFHTAELHHLKMEGLPHDDSSVESACIVTYYQRMSTWPLLMDPMSMATNYWLKGREPDGVFTSHQDDSLSGKVVQCLTEGKALVVHDVDVNRLIDDNASNPLQPLLVCRKQYDEKRVVVNVCGQDVEMHPDFRLYMVANGYPSSVPAAVASRCGVVLFYPEPTGIEIKLLCHFVAVTNRKTYTELMGRQKDLHTHMLRADQLEEEVLQALAADCDVELDQKVVNVLLQLNKSFAYAQDVLAQTLQTHKEMMMLHLNSLSYLARRASIITNTVLMMGSVRAAYRTSFSHVRSVYTKFITDIGNRIKGEDALTHLTNYAHGYFEKRFLDLDRMLFSLMLALEIETNLGRATIAERMILLSLTPGTKFTIKGLVSQIPVEDAPVISFGKKPLDWISESQWQGMLMLASHFAWIHPLLSQLGSSGKDVLWRALGEGPSPEAMPQSESYGAKLAPYLQQFLPMQRLLITFALRPDRKTHFVSVFICSVMRQKPFSPSYYEISGVMKSNAPTKTPLLIYDDDPHLPLMKLEQLAHKNNAKLHVHNMFGGETERDLTLLSTTLKQNLKKGQWVFITNVYTSPSFFPHLLALLSEAALDWTDEKHDDGSPVKGRVWLSSHVDCSIPLSVLEQCVCVAVDAPKDVLSNMAHSLLSCTHGDLIGYSTRLEWLPLLHNVIMLHIGLCLRQLTTSSAFCRAYPWNHTHLIDALHVCSREFQYAEQLSVGIGGVKPVSWSGIRSLISEVVYGSLVVDATDLHTVSALTEHWLHPGVHKREHGQYHIPSLFFTPSTRLQALIQAVEGTFPPLVYTAELCGLHNTPQMSIDWQSHIFPPVHRLHCHLEATKPFSLSTEPQSSLRKPATTRTFSSLSLYSKPAKLASTTAKTSMLAAQLLEKLPSSIPVSTPLLEQSMESLPASVFSQTTAAQHSSKMRDVYATLVHNVDHLLELFPAGLKKELVHERLRRCNTDTPFGRFIGSEISTINEHLQVINTSLQKLSEKLQSSSASTNTSRGDVFSSPLLVDTARAILTLSVPDHWSRAVGSSAPPSSLCGLQEWLTDLVFRQTFLDKVLSLGIDKMPTYWIGGFYHPETLLSIFKQVYITKGNRSSPEQLVFIGDLTNRDKDHIRDPPADGLFVYGVYLWGCHFEKTASMDLRDVPPRPSSLPYALPAVHLTLKPLTVVTLHSFAVEQKLPYVHYCPCFTNTSLRCSAPLFYIKATSQDIPSNKWTTRNLFCTLRPY